jgi:SNF2 family DNA or RNA helicase/predicted RNA methylase
MTTLQNDLERLKLAKEARDLITERARLTDSTTDVLRALNIGKRLRDIAIALGKAAPAPDVIPEPAPVAEVRTEPTAEFYPEEGRKTLAQRQKDNNAAIALIREIQESGRAVTDEDRVVLAKYSGNGGGLTGADGLTGSPHEYYTPKPVAAAMWELLGEMGFQGGSVCDPSAGTGVFTATRPKTAVMTQIELDATSGAVNGAINDGPTVSTTVSPFEAIAAETPDEIYDAIITNVPFGDNAMRGDAKLKDKRFQKANLQEYFILRSLQKLKPNGLAAFIVPPSIVSGKGSKSQKLRLQSSLMAEFVGAYRLPNKIFSESAAADTITDVIVFRKFSRETARKIDELQTQSPDTLTQARVLWDEFLEGRYFLGTGHKYILGEVGTTNGKFGEVEAVISDDSISNIARMIKRFPGSHIDWALLEATETAPIVYQDGDVLHKDGQTLEMRDGEWTVLESAVADDRKMLDVGTKITTAFAAIEAGVTWKDAQEYARYCNAMGSYGDVPAWLTATIKALESLGEGDMQPWWEAITAGMAAMQLMQDADSVEPFNYLEAYPVLSAQLARAQSYGNKTIGKASRLVKDALLSIRNARYKGDFTAFWRGEIKANVETVALTPTQLYEKTKYESEDETGYVSVEKLRTVFSDFDPLTSDEWCVSADGQHVTHANDYYTGSYAAFLTQANAELEQCTDPDIRAKLVKQMEAGKARINTVDVSKMTFSLFTPHISPLQKLEFFKQYVSPDIFLTVDADGRDVFDIKQPSVGKWASEEEKAAWKAMQRFVKGYLRNQNITTMSKSADVESDPAKEAALLRRIKEITDKAKAQFDAWARANDEIQVSLHNKLNAPDALRFIEEPDGTPLDIPNLNTTTFRPHAYQYAAARRYARQFSGILGFDVGLGKTLTALASVQYAQSIGVKKKTMFVVPNATLTNWKKEAGKAYLDTSDCLFVGIVKGKDGKDKVDNAQVKIDLNVIRENRHSKIFMTLEAFKLIPVRDETMDAYVAYLTENDDAYLLAEEDAMKKRANIAAASKQGNVKDIGAKSGAIPYFEDMGVDSLVLDEAHNYKNSKMTSSEFKGAKYLADPSKSQRGMDMQAKSWYVRGLSTRNDGVLSLTATPVTNSPLEVYSMLTLALGEREVNAMYGVTGADSFMAAACDIEEREEENIVGMMRPVRVFTGLQNAGLLRRLLQTSALIKTADDVKADGINIVVPEFDEIATGVDIGQDSYDLIIDYKNQYLEAVERLKAGGGDAEDKLTGSPFNLIRKMTRVINDPEMDAGIFAFKFQADQREAAQKAIDGFNKKNIVEERDYWDSNADPADIRTKVVKDAETGESVSKYLVTIRARMAQTGNAIELLSTDYSTQESLLKLLDAGSITPTINVSPKLAALIENVKLENLHPRYIGQAKQIIFCDELSLHHKIKLALVQQVGISASKIKIVNAVSVDVAGMQDVQDGYNADGEDNKYTIVIANKKAEVGINLQKGTQAIHHMTIGWTPDSVHQRNGRGVRQGNPVETVKVYHYDADGTFDAYKRKLVGIKADWIGALMQGDGSKVVIEGDMTSSDYELLANAVGDASAMDRINDEISARNKRQKQAVNKAAQLQSVRIIEAQANWLARFGMGAADDRDADGRKGFTAWIKNKNGIVSQTAAKIGELQERLDKTESTLMATRLRGQITDLSQKLQTQSSVLDGLPRDSRGVVVVRSEWSAVTDDEKATAAYANWQKDVTMANRMRDEAAVTFQNRTDDGYTGDTLDAFMRGDAAIVTGNLVAVGSLVEYQGKLLVVTKPRRATDAAKGFVGYNPADQSETELLRLTGPVYLEQNTPQYSAAIARAVAADERVIADNPSGFAASSPYLYSSLNADVREALTVAIPSTMVDPDTISLAPPLFPFILVTDAVGSEFTDRIKAEQESLIAERDFRDNVRLKDLRVIGPKVPTDVPGRCKAIRDYSRATGLRATAQDVACISSYLSLEKCFDSLGLNDEFFRALPDGVAQSKSPEDLETWAQNWLNNAQDFLTVDRLESALGYDISRFRREQNRIDDGKERWYVVSQSQRYAISAAIEAALKTAIEGGFLNDEIAAASSGYGSYMPADITREYGRQFTELMFADTGDYIELKVGVDDARAAMSLSKNARLYVENWADANALALAIISQKWAAMCQWAKKAKSIRALDAAGVDIQGILTAIRSLSGVLSADVGTTDETKFADRYSAHFVYHANTYINITFVRYSDTQKKVAAAGAEGLQGRTFDSVRKCFRVTIKDGETFSDGKPVASVNSLFKHLGLNMSDYLA